MISVRRLSPETTQILNNCRISSRLKNRQFRVIFTAFFAFQDFHCHPAVICSAMSTIIKLASKHSIRSRKVVRYRHVFSQPNSGVSAVTKLSDDLVLII